MKTLVAGLLACLLLTASVYGQYDRNKRFSWQEACFNNFSAPFCQGSDIVIKQKSGKNGTSSASGPGFVVPAQNVTAAEIIAGAIDWRFADPSAGTLVGFHAREIAASPIARKVIARLAATQGLAPVDAEKLMERLNAVAQVGISIHQDQMVVMLTGRSAESTLPPLESGWKAASVAGNAVLVGHVDAVDQAIQRLAKNDPPSELMGLAMSRQATAEFWVESFTGLPDAVAGTAQVKQYSLGIWLRDYLTSHLELEFSAAPDAKTLATWGPALDRAPEDNVVRVTTRVEADEVQQRLAAIAANPIAQQLTAIVKPIRYLPIPDITALQKTKPIIYGLN